MGFEMMPTKGDGKPKDVSHGMSRREFFSKFVPKRVVANDESRPENAESTRMPDDSELDNGPEPKGMSRREFLKTGLGVLGYAVAGGVGGYAIPNLPHLRNRAEDALFGEGLKKEIREKQLFILERYGVDVRFNEPASWMTKNVSSSASGLERPDRDLGSEDFSLAATVASDERESYQTYAIETLSEMKRNMDILVQELAFFPPEFVRRSPLKRIDLYGSMICDYKDKDGVARYSSLVGHVEDISSDRSDGKSARELLLSVSGDSFNRYNENGWVEGRIRVVFPHEMLHALDDMPDEEWYSAIRLGDVDNAGLRYAVSQEQKDSFVIDSITNLKTSGFSKNYGRVDVREDRATVFELLSKASSVQLHDRMDEDPILARKLSVLAGYLLRESWGLMDGNYWDIVREGKGVPRGYFEQEKDRILRTNYDEYVSDERHFNTGGLRIMGIPTREEYESWQQQLRGD